MPLTHDAEREHVRRQRQPPAAQQLGLWQGNGDGDGDGVRAGRGCM